MSLAKGIYGIEYNPRQTDKDSPGVAWIVIVVVVVALVSLTWTVVKRVRSADPAAQDAGRPPATQVAAADGSAPPAQGQSAESSPSAVAPGAPLPSPVKVTEEIAKRPAKLRNLLMRLEEAKWRKDVEMEVTTIETIRGLPGSPAADLDDALARRLGCLNMRRLFDLKNAQWVKHVSARRGDSAQRVASENGSTLASFIKLNGGMVDKVERGRKFYVLNHPRFNLVIHRRLRTADLSLNGKYFKRYDLLGEVTGKVGSYKVPSRWRNFWSGVLGVKLKSDDREELEMLLPEGVPVLISEM